MPRRERAPQIIQVTLTDSKNRERLIKRLVQQRIGFGKSTLYDTETHEARYPLDIIGPVLEKYERKAIKIGRKPDLSADEERHLAKIFKSIGWIIFLGLLSLIPFTCDDQLDTASDWRQDYSWLNSMPEIWVLFFDEKFRQE